MSGSSGDEATGMPPTRATGLPAGPRPPSPPPARPHLFTAPDGSTRIDPYHWLRDDEARDPQVLSYLRAENEYARAVLAEYAQTQEELLRSMESRVPHTERTPPVPGPVVARRTSHAGGSSRSSTGAGAAGARDVEGDAGGPPAQQQATWCWCWCWYWYGTTRGPGQRHWVHRRWMVELPPPTAGAAVAVAPGAAGPLAYGPPPGDPGEGEVVLDINQLAEELAAGRADWAAGAAASAGDAGDAGEEQAEDGAGGAGGHSGAEGAGCAPESSSSSSSSSSGRDGGRRGSSYCDVGCVKPSPDGSHVAFTLDCLGDEQYALYVRRVEDGCGSSSGGNSSGGRSSSSGEGGGGGPRPRLLLRDCGPTVEWSADGRSVLALRLTRRTHEAYRLVRIGLGPEPEPEERAEEEKKEGPEEEEGNATVHVLLEDSQPGASLELAGHTSCGRWLLVGRKGSGGRTLMAMQQEPPPPPPAVEPAAPDAQPEQQQPLPPLQLPPGLSLGSPHSHPSYRQPHWALVAPESAECDVLRADYLYGGYDGGNSDSSCAATAGATAAAAAATAGDPPAFAVLMDTDTYPDGHVCAVTGGDLRSRVVLLPGSPGLQIVDMLVAEWEEGQEQELGKGSSTIAGCGSSGLHRRLVVHTLCDMQAAVHVYDISDVRQQVDAARAVTAAAAAAVVGQQGLEAGVGGAGPSDTYSSGRDEDTDAEEDADVGPPCVSPPLPLLWTYLPGDESGAPAPTTAAVLPATGTSSNSGLPASTAPSISTSCRLGTVSSLALQHGVWRTHCRLPLQSHSDHSPHSPQQHPQHPTRLPYVRLSYSSITAPTTTVELDLGRRAAACRQLEAVAGGFTPADYLSATLWVTVSPTADGTPTTRVPASLACRADAWPPTTGVPLPAVVQVYGAYGRKLLPDFNPADLAILDGVRTSVAGSGGGGDGASYDGEAGPEGGISLQPKTTFDSSTSSHKRQPCLLVIAHVRGGGELGAAWHRGGKRRRKANTAADLAAVAEALVAGGYCRAGQLAVWGRSAGGLAAGMALCGVHQHHSLHLPGAATAAPSAPAFFPVPPPPLLFSAALLDVPFLDVLGAMCDPGLRLTAQERPEWGDPEACQADYAYIRSYSPYEHVEALATSAAATCISSSPRLALLLTCALHDSRVPYWGPAKFAARLRAALTERKSGGPGGGMERGLAPRVMLLTEMGAGGHFASGGLADRAMRAAFLLQSICGLQSTY
ncbi:hypothetical protein HYH02_003709 [Chlamydomonas schloesseri]|uniref:Prolyl endopeptidase-like n=1 Tax=Chlamydomonas schloesseri TaxID=2026947 RepID=A0A835WST9_9CHLO|nr:hypothetical protein HYH02_003709 [Chlamydomonas schloesseri]|eukprot:KAG2451935.1 hypothetical protein HYH02_003709 [Chlamydomonas schloesseri]